MFDMFGFNWGPQQVCTWPPTPTNGSLHACCGTNDSLGVCLYTGHASLDTFLCDDVKSDSPWTFWNVMADLHYTQDLVQV